MDGVATRTRPVAGVVAASALALVLVSGLLLASGTQASGGVTCTPGASTIQLSWTGDSNVFQYEAFLSKDSIETSQILAWNSASGTASVTFSSLAAGTYSVRVVKQTVDNSWIQFGEQTCTVTETTTTTDAPTTTTAATTTTTAPASGGAGSISCTAGTSSIRVTLDPADGTRSFEVFAEHSSGYPRVGQLSYPDSNGDFWHEFTSLAQGTWNLSGYADFNDGARRQLNNISCTVTAPSFETTTTTTAATTTVGTTTTATTTPSNSAATGAPTISGAAQVGQTLTADTSGIADADGLANVTYSYQWLTSRDTEIAGATSSAYTVQVSDTDKEIRVRVTFTDDAGNEESLTSAATSAVVVGGL